MPSRRPDGPDRGAAAIVVAAGSGSRSGLKIPKQFLRVAGRTLLEHAVGRLSAHPLIGTIVVVVPRSRVAAVSRRLRGVDAVVAGGARRQESVRRGLAALGDAKGIVLVHDAARPLVPAAVIRSVVESARRHGSGVPALAPADTVKEVGASGRVLRTLRRERLRLVQTPQAFRIDWLRRASDLARSRRLHVTDDASMVEAAGYPVRLVEGSPMSFKVTSPEDVARIRALLKG